MNPSSRPSPLRKGRRRSFPRFRSKSTFNDSLQRSDLNEEIVSAPPRGEPGRLLVDELRGEVARLVTAGPLAPATSILICGPEFHFANSGETLLALAEALPWLDDAGRAAAARFGFEEMARRDPLWPQEVPTFAGARREFFTPIPPEEQERLSGTKGKAAPAFARGLSVAVSQEACANNVYALWAAWAD